MLRSYNHVPGGSFVLIARGYKESSLPMFLMRTSILRSQLIIIWAKTVDLEREHSRRLAGGQHDTMTVSQPRNPT